MGKLEHLDVRRRPESESPNERGGVRRSRFDALESGESTEAACALCGGAGKVWRDEQGLLQQSFEHEDPCLLDVLMRHVAEELRLKLGLSLIKRVLVDVDLSDPRKLREANLLVCGWVNRLMAGEDVALSSFDPAD